MNDKPIPTNVTLTQHDKDIVESIEKKHGLSFSAALRFILREWSELKRSSEPVEKVTRDN